MAQPNFITLHQNNDKGKDYFVGDIHGCYDILMWTLEQKGFNFDNDRLFSVGDLGDRGPASLKCAELIYKPWFFAVRGNHEQMAIDAYRHEQWGMLVMNGGQWFYDLSNDEQMAVADAYDTLPHMREVMVGDKRIGVAHGDVLVEDWTEYYKPLIERQKDNLLWGRTRISYDIKDKVKNIDIVVVGHTPLKQTACLGNVLYIDTGAVYGRELTVLSADEVLRFR